jgi:hypothetical protein
MRRRLLLLVLLAGGLATAGGATLSATAGSGPSGPVPATSFARAERADVPAPTALSRVRDGLGRDHDTRRDVAAALGVALVLTLAGGWWLARERAARVRHPRLLAARRTRAPPGMPATLHCC